jgi:hypothetical protein
MRRSKVLGAAGSVHAAGADLAMVRRHCYGVLFDG